MLCIVVATKYGNSLVSIPTQIGERISCQESTIDSYTSPVKESRCHMNNNDPVLVIGAHVTPYCHTSDHRQISSITSSEPNTLWQESYSARPNKQELTFGLLDCVSWPTI